MRSGQQRLGFTEPTLTGRQYSTGFPLSGNLPPASFLPCDVIFLVICPTISTSSRGEAKGSALLPSRDVWRKHIYTYKLTQLKSCMFMLEKMNCNDP